MIDDKKIEEAARETADLYEQDLPIMSYNEDTEVDGQHHFCQEFGAKLFKDGAKWAINEFLKDLWHPDNEEPNKGKMILMEMRNGDIYAPYFVDDEYSWERICTMFTTTSWLYIDNLFPKEGGNHD